MGRAGGHADCFAEGMTTSLRLHALFASLLGATAVAVGCNGAIAVEPDAGADAGVDGALTDGALPDGATPDARPPGDGGTLPPFALSVCLSDDERSYLFPKDATLASGVQFLGGYELSGDSKPTGMKPSTHKVGLACSKANDPTACSTALDAFEPATPYWSACQGFCPPFPARQVRTTSGDTVAVIGKREDVKKGFLPIDTPTEAVAAVEARHYVACESGKNNVLQHADGTFSVKVIDAQCAQDPKDPTKSYDTVDEISFRVTPAGVVTEEARVRVKEQPTTGCPVAGRKPAGLEPANTNGAGGLADLASCAGAYFASMAHLEAASVIAFERMAAELGAHGAPEGLVARALAAAEDERRHARAIGALAAERAATVPEVVAGAFLPRSLLAMAVENRREGCVRETYGALLAHYQARASGSPDVRRAMTAIAQEETEHAALSWDLDAWLVARLDEAELAVVRVAEREALRDLAAECAQTFDADTRAVVGLPPSDIALALFRGVQAGLGLAA